MKCPKCGSEQLIVTNTRGKDWGIKRTRVCLSCGNHIPTIEIYKITDEALKSLEISKLMTRKKEN